MSMLNYSEFHAEVLLRKSGHGEEILRNETKRQRRAKSGQGKLPKRMAKGWVVTVVAKFVGTRATKM